MRFSGELPLCGADERGTESQRCMTLGGGHTLRGDDMEEGQRSIHGFFRSCFRCAGLPHG